MLTETRVSETAHQDIFSNELLVLLGEIEARLSVSFGVDPLMLESWQATRYPIGGRFDYHLDSGYWDDHHAGDRVRTFLIYLATPVAGGGTHFRALDVLVEARERRLVVWEDLFPDGSPNHSMIHAGLPLLAGDKITLVTWQRQRVSALRRHPVRRRFARNERTGALPANRPPDLAAIWTCHRS